MNSMPESQDEYSKLRTSGFSVLDFLQIMLDVRNLLIIVVLCVANFVRVAQSIASQQYNFTIKLSQSFKFCEYLLLRLCVFDKSTLTKMEDKIL